MKHSILITGSSSGIGRSIALYLAREGHQVFAGVRKQSDGESLQKEVKTIQPVVIDVLNSESIANCVQKISLSRHRGLPFSLVNNAGIAVPGPVEALKLEALRNQFDVNFFGLIETTQNFLPLIRETKGRIINVSSIGGRVSTPFLGAYSASKFAVEGVTDALRLELAPFGVKVILIEPGPIQSKIWSKGLDNRQNVENFCESDRLKLYMPRFERFERIVEKVASKSIPAENVAKKVCSALESEDPPARVVVASVQSRMEMMAAEWLPTKTFDKIVSKVLKA